MSGNTWVNNDGLVVRFGTEQGKRGDRAATTRTSGKTNELILRCDLAGPARTAYTMDRNNDGTKDGFSGLDPKIPAGAKIVSVRFIEEEAEAGGTAWEVGTYQLNGTAIDIDGLVNDNAGTPEAGDDVGTQYTADSYVTFVTTGTYTAGKFTVIVEYITD